MLSLMKTLFKNERIGVGRNRSHSYLGKNRILKETFFLNVLPEIQQAAHVDIATSVFVAVL